MIQIIIILLLLLSILSKDAGSTKGKPVINSYNNDASVTYTGHS